MSGSEIFAGEAVQLLDELTSIVARACTTINAISPSAGRLKPDQSPVTAADEASEALILEELARTLPGVPVISEESPKPNKAFSPSSSFIVVDPLDGTREYLAGSDEFTVNLAIITGGIPVAGIVAAPRLHQVWRGVVGIRAERLRLNSERGEQAQPVRTRHWPDSAVVTMSRSHLDKATEAFVAALGPVQRVPSGSAIKFCRVAEGTADVYPRLATTCEWDIAAGHALVVAAGGVVTTPQRSALTYGRIEQDFRVPAFVAWGDPAKAAKS